jgi:hypothetical protein
VSDDQEHAPADLKLTAAERAAGLVLPASGLVWTAAEIMHLSGQPGALDVAVATALAATAAWGASAHWDRVPRQLAAWIAAAGAWLVPAASMGPVALAHVGGYPFPPLTAIGALIAAYGWRKAQQHEAVTGAREWRAQKAGWLGQAHEWGLGGSHLLDYKSDLVVDRYEVDTRSTGKRASAFANRGQEELIAEREGLPVSRVHVRRHSMGGRIVITVTRSNPWAHPVLHPVFDSKPETVLPVPCSIRDRVQIGRSPETGRALTLPLWDETGGKNIVLVGIKGSGKGVVLDCISERVTAAYDAVQIRVNLSVKGEAEPESWGPACHLTAFGVNQKTRAVKVLRTVSQVIEWRARSYKRGQYVPTGKDPLIVVILDEADSAMAVAEVRKAYDDLATKGREYGVTTIRAGQRGTTDYGSAKTRAMDDVFVIGKVNRDNEVYLAAGNAGIGLPDMAAYGEGAAGVWGIAELGGLQQRGRSWAMGKTAAAQGTAVEELAQERAFTQPELPDACREHLGQAYEILLSTDVFAKWANARPPQDAATPLPDGQQPEAEDGTATATTPVVTLTDEETLRNLDLEDEEYMDDGMRKRLAEIDARNAATRKLLEETAALPKPPEVDPEAWKASVAERWRQVGEQANLSENDRNVLIGLLRNGTTIGGLAEALKVSKWTARTYLEKLRNEGLVRLEGEKRSARWLLTESDES